MLSVPCSSGEEPYSIAMALLSAGFDPDAIAIDAVDVSLEAVRRTREGTYRDGSFRSEIGEWKQYFRTSARGRELDQRVRSVVRVAHGNLVDASFAPPREQYDVIFCRNLLIYFDAEAQTRALASLAALLAPSGLLVVGSADSFAARRAGFEPLPGFERSFLFRRKSQQAISEARDLVSRRSSLGGAGSRQAGAARCRDADALEGPRQIREPHTIGGGGATQGRRAVANCGDRETCQRGIALVGNRGWRKGVA